MLNNVKGRKFSQVNYNDAKRLADQCLSRTEMMKRDSLIYKKALKEGWLDEFFPILKFTFQGESHEKIFKKLPIQSNDPLIIDFFNKLHEKKEDSQHIALKAGLSINTLHRWRTGANGAMLKEYVYACQALGYKVTLTPIEEPGDDTA